MKRFPEGIAIDIGFICNNNCVFCVQNNMGPKRTNLTTSEAKKMMREVREFFNNIIFNGGEPTIREDIIDLVHYAKQIGFESIMLISNARMFSYDAFCKKMILAGLRLVFITLEASNERLHDKLTTVKGSFQQTIAGIKNLKKYGLEVHTNTVINKLNHRDLKNLPYLMKDLGVDFSKLSFMRFSGDNFEKNAAYITIRMSEIVPSIRRAAEAFKKVKKEFIIQEIPACVMKTHIACLRMGKKIPKINTKHPHSKNFITKYKRDGNIKLPQCESCFFNENCLGPWQEYIEYFGQKEFQPIKAIDFKGHAIF